MTLVYYFLILAIILLLTHRVVEELASKKKMKNIAEKSRHSHDLLMSIGEVLINRKGIEQYNELKPQLDQAKRYYLNHCNAEVTNINQARVENKEPVKLKVV